MRGRLSSGMSGFTTKVYPLNERKELKWQLPRPKTFLAKRDNFGFLKHHFELDVLEGDDKNVDSLIRQEKKFLFNVLRHIDNVKVGGAPTLAFSNAPVEVLDLLEYRHKLERAVRYRGVWFFMCWIVFVPFTIGYALAFSSLDLVNRIVFALPFIFVPAAAAFVYSPLWTAHCQIGAAVIILMIAGFSLHNQVVTGDLGNMFWILLAVLTLNASPLILANAFALICVVTAAFLSYLFFHPASTSTLHLAEILVLGACILGYMTSLTMISIKGQQSERMGVIIRHKALAKAVALSSESKRTSELLHSALPPKIASKLGSEANEETLSSLAESFDSVTVMFVEVCQFAKLSSHLGQSDVLRLLDIVFSEFDALAPEYNMYKVETIGPIYLLVGGCPEVSKNHAENAADLALKYLEIMSYINENIRDLIPGMTTQVQIRIGLNSGPVTTGIVGDLTPRFKLFGDTVNTASRMGSNCLQSACQCSPSTADILQRTGQYNLAKTGAIQVKGKGTMFPSLLLGAHGRKTKDEQIRNADNYHTTANLAPAQEKKIGTAARQTSTSLSRTLERMETSTKIDDVPDSIATIGNTRRFMITGRLDLGHFFSSIREGLFPRDPDFVQTQTLESIALVRKYSRRLLILSMCISLAMLVTFFAKSSLPFPKGNRPAQFWNRRTILFISVCTGGLALLICVPINVASRRGYIRTTQFLVLSCVAACAGVLFLSNYYGNRFNSFGIAALFCFFFYVRCIPLVVRGVWSVLLAGFYCGGLVTLAEKYPGRYMSYVKESDTVSMNFYISKQLVLLMFLILIQIFVVASHESALQNDFVRDKALQTQTKLLNEQREKSKCALNRLLPPTITDRLVSKNKNDMVVDSFELVTILFTDMVGFTSFSQRLTSMRLMRFLNHMFKRFDSISRKYDLYKVEIIGDAYFAVGGCPTRCRDHTEKVVNAAHEMLDCLPELQILAESLLAEQASEGAQDDGGTPKISIRIGVHVGPAIAGVVGSQDPRYHLFGEAVNLAQEFESTSEHGKVHASWNTVHQLQKTGADRNFDIIEREPVDLRPLGPIQVTYLIDRKKATGEYYRKNLGGGGTDDDRDDDKNEPLPVTN